ncbi:MAG TPA: sulfite exporter TauE/SafE family protein [Deltaproteobacteria bacterium]|nr:sulfite exporter TauE/SafE family protein [Deltaproteobacteria bacterium]
MGKYLKGVLVAMAVLCLFSGALFVTAPAYADSLEEAIQQGITDGKINKTAEPGFLGIPGAPKVNFVLGFFWAIWVGWIFSTVGAFGGIMAGVGHITIFGLGDYARGFGKGYPMNNLVTDSIRVSNQWLVGLSGLISSTNYYRMGRLVAPLGMCLAIGGVGGSWLIPDLTAGKISLKSYLGYFGIAVLALGFILLRETTKAGQAKRKKAKEAASAFEKQAKKGDEKQQGVKILEGSWTMMFIALGVVVVSALWANLAGGAKWVAYLLALAGWGVTFFAGTIRFSFYGVEFSFKAYIPMLGGIFIAALASFLGVGGGFLYVPFLTSVAGLPMFLVAGTSGLVVLVGMIVSIFSYMVGKSVPVQWGFIGIELVGIFVGSMIGPRTSKYIPDIWLKRLFVLLAFYVGIRYITKGFLGYSIVPPF